MNSFSLLEDFSGPHLTRASGAMPERELLEKILQHLDAPRGVPAIGAVLTTVSKAVASVFSTLPTPTTAALHLKQSIMTLHESAKHSGNEEYIEAPSALKGIKHKHPAWVQFADSKTSVNRLTRIYAGLLLLAALARNKPIPASGTKYLGMITAEDDVPEQSICILLAGSAPDETVDAPWLHSLHKLWRDVVRAYSLEPPPSPSPRGRVVSELMNNVFSVGSAERAGATKHRSQSKRQVTKSFAAIGDEIKADTLHGALGVLVCITGFSVDVVSNLEILDGVIDGAWPAGICIQEGSIKVNLELIVNEPSRALKGCIPSTYILARPLPEGLVANLRARLLRFHDAKTLRDLYPGASIPQRTDLVYQSSDEIAPTWSRLRHSPGLAARQMGLDCMSTFLASCDLNHIPRSKLHYACISAEEIFDGMSYMYSMAGWGRPAPIIANRLGFGSRAVPTQETIKRHDTYLVESCVALRPGNHAGLHRLLSFHNAFIRLSSWRIALLLALRESSTLNLTAEVDETNVVWIALHDKVTPHDQGQQPVPLCRFARDTFTAIRFHCRDMHARVSRQHSSASDIARWLDSVARGSNTRMLCLATDTFKAIPVGTSDFTHAFADDYELPPDVGRKVMENHLRHHNLPSSLIDGVLRHSIRGQYRLSAFSNTCLDEWTERTANAMDAVATLLFHSVAHGLSKV